MLKMSAKLKEKRNKEKRKGNQKPAFNTVHFVICNVFQPQITESTTWNLDACQVKKHHKDIIKSSTSAHKLLGDCCRGRAINS